jgi:hypothetical protein
MIKKNRTINKQMDMKPQETSWTETTRKYTRAKERTLHLVMYILQCTFSLLAEPSCQQVVISSYWLMVQSMKQNVPFTL